MRSKLIKVLLVACAAVTVSVMPKAGAGAKSALVTGTAHAASGPFLYNSLDAGPGSWKRLTDPADDQCIALEASRAWNLTNRIAVLYSNPNCEEQGRITALGYSGKWMNVVENRLKSVRFTLPS